MFGFIVPSCCKNDIHYIQLGRCISSIKQYHPDHNIIIIDDSNESYHEQIIQYFELDKFIHIKRTLHAGSADQQTFKILIENDFFDKAVIIQDSMIINSPLTCTDTIVDIQFIWHFTNHRIHWDMIKEPTSVENIENHISTHNDLVKYCLNKDYTDNQDFLKFALNAMDRKETWVGCFGNLCIVTRECVRNMDSIVPFVDTFIRYKTNRNRRVNESIFSLICHYVYPHKDFEKSYDGLYFDGHLHGGYSYYMDKPTGFDNLQWCAVHDFFSKISFNR